MTIKTAILFAAGFGKRLNKITENIPKPLVRIKGKTLLNYSLDMLCQYGFENIIINTHYLHQQIEYEVQQYININSPRTKIILIHEKDILETRGAVKNIQNYIQGDIIVTLNSDSIFANSSNIISTLYNLWEPHLSFLFLLQNKNQAYGYHGTGDIKLNDNRVIFCKNSDYIYTGLQIMDPRIAFEYPKTKFSLSELFLQSQYHKKSLINTNQWYHITYPKDIETIETIFDYDR